MAEKVQDSVEVAGEGGRVTLAGLTEQLTLSSVRATVPANPLTLATVIVDVPGDPTTTVTLAGLAERVKSCTMNVTVAALDTEPLVAVTMTGKVPAEGKVHNSVAVAGEGGRVTLAGPTEQ